LKFPIKRLLITMKKKASEVGSDGRKVSKEERSIRKKTREKGAGVQVGKKSKGGERALGGRKRECREKKGEAATKGLLKRGERFGEGREGKKERLDQIHTVCAKSRFSN